MKVFSSKKRVAAIGAITAATLVGGGVAVAYWTNNGSGSGEATVGTDTDPIVVTATTVDLLSPGGPGVEVSFSAENPAGYNQLLSSIQLASIEADDPLCQTALGTDFEMSDVIVNDPDGVDIDPGATVSLADTGTLYMLDSGVNQNDCKNATLTLNFTTS